MQCRERTNSRYLSSQSVSSPARPGRVGPDRPIDTGASIINRTLIGPNAGYTTARPEKWLATLQRRAPTILSLSLGLLLLASAESALALRPARGAAPSAYSQTAGTQAPTAQQRKNAAPMVYGQEIGNWGHAWWQWVSNFPAAQDPILQDGSVDCSAGQSGKVWFLAGTFGGAAVRSCAIKQGKAIFLPLFNGIYWTPVDPAIPEDCTDEASCRAGVGANIDTLTSWSCTVDGTPCVWFAQVVRAQSDALSLNIPAGSSFTAFGYAPGLRQVSISDGYWVMLDPLPRGTHEVRFTATNSGGFSLDVTYHLTVGK